MVASFGDCIGCDGYILDEQDAPYCPSCARERRQMKVVCCWCKPPHTMRAGSEPASHGMCPVALERWCAEVDAMLKPSA